MADGTYERRGPREAELKRLARLLAEQRAQPPRQPVRAATRDIVSKAQSDDRG